jgi:hypothetical protein
MKNIIVRKWKLFFSAISLILANNIYGSDTVTIPNVKNSRISLNGTWKIDTSPTHQFWLDTKMKSRNWQDIKVPGECAMQGFKIAYNKPFVYKKQIQIPADYKGQLIYIGFDGVYSNARVWINGHYIISHTGGFTTWFCNITPYVISGKKAWLTVEVTDNFDNISYGSQYAFHPIGGILRDVYLIAKPKKNIEHLYHETDLDGTYTNATLKLDYKLSEKISNDSKLEFKLNDEEGKEVALSKSSQTLQRLDNGKIEIQVKYPLKWEAEHPHLYTFTTTLIEEGKVIEKISRKIGFREITVSGNQLLINGKSIKLRGTCRHDISAELGRSTSKELDETDVKLIKEANLNYVRTSHYPPTQAFLDYCDKYGLYVEEETAVCFTKNSENDTAFTTQYLSQFAEMIARDRNSTSVTMWSLGNESKWGINFQKEYEYAKATDLSRPVIFPNFGGIPDGVKCFDIDYVHYPDYKGSNIYHSEIKEFSNLDLPVLNDEWAHVPCYMTETLQDESGARDFWGQSIKKFWDNISATDGAGGAIWCMVDDYFMLPDSCKGTGEWGWVDLWRRKKPEFWHIKKAHSPIQISNSNIEAFKAGLPLLIPVTNRYDFTNLNEIDIKWSSNKASGTINPSDIPPRSKGVIAIPASGLQRGDSVTLSFTTKDNNELVDTYNITLGRRTVSFTPPINSTLIKSETTEDFSVTSGDYQFIVSKKSGLFTSILYGKDTLVTDGPYLNLTAMQPCNEVFFEKCDMVKWDGKKWKLSELKTEVHTNYIKIISRGTVDTINVNFEFLIRSGGLFSIGYEIENPTFRQIQEAGISLSLSNNYSGISWDKQSLWSAYPTDHIGRPIGTSPLYNTGILESYRTVPAHQWNMDSKAGYFYFGLDGGDKKFADLINEVKSLKTNLNFYNIIFKDGLKRLRVEAQGNVAARLVKSSASTLNLLINNEWDYVNLNWGNYEKNIHITNNYKNIIQFRLTDNDGNVNVSY